MITRKNKKKPVIKVENDIRLTKAGILIFRNSKYSFCNFLKKRKSLFGITGFVTAFFTIL
jgi:hypothetical protein